MKHVTVTQSVNEVVIYSYTSAVVGVYLVELLPV